MRVTEANFLEVPPDPSYDAVVMNPPFYGTHYMKHVMHAYEFLKPGGKLIAILPATVQIGTTRKHKSFRKWATSRMRFREFDQGITDLPVGSFKESGTGVSTVVMELEKSRW